MRVVKTTDKGQRPGVPVGVARCPEGVAMGRVGVTSLESVGSSPRGQQRGSRGG